MLGFVIALIIIIILKGFWNKINPIAAPINSPTPLTTTIISTTPIAETKQKTFELSNQFDSDRTLKMTLNYPETFNLNFQKTKTSNNLEQSLITYPGMEMTLRFLKEEDYTGMDEIKPLEDPIDINNNSYRILVKKDSQFNYYKYVYGYSYLDNSNQKELHYYSNSYSPWPRLWYNNWFVELKIEKNQEKDLLPVLDQMMGQSIGQLNVQLIYRGEFAANQDANSFNDRGAATDFIYFQVAGSKKLPQEEQVYQDKYIINKKFFKQFPMLQTAQTKQEFTIDCLVDDADSGLTGLYRIYEVIGVK